MAVAILCLVVTGCSVGSEGRAREPGGPVSASADATSTATTADASTTGDEATTTAPALAARLSLPDWYKAYAFWLEDLRQAVTTSGLAVSGLGDTRRVTGGGTLEQELADLQGTIEAVGECVDFERTLLPAPRRVRTAVAVLQQSCEPFSRGAELAADALEQRDQELYAAAAVEWRAAAALVASGNRRLPVSMPTEALPLQVEGGRTDVSRVEPLLSEIASVDTPGEYAVPVRCWSRADWRRIVRGELRRRDIAGYATSWLESANLAPSICQRLTTVAYEKERPQGRGELVLAFAAMVLMHEAAHVEIPLHAPKEADATCYGMQHIRTVVRKLGLSKRYADRLASRFWFEVYPYVQRGYRSPKCRDGGDFDIRLASDVWP